MRKILPAQRRVQMIRQALLDAAEKADMNITVKEAETLAYAAVEAVYARDGRAASFLSSDGAWGRSAVGDRLRLKPYQVEYLRMMANGLTAEEMASALDRSLYTVKDNCKRLYRDMGVRERSHAVAMGMACGLITAEDVRVYTGRNEGFIC